MSTASFTHLATVTASTKRGAISGSPPKQSTPTTSISSLVCTPLDPVSAELAQRVGLQTPYEYLSTVVDGTLDIKEGDVLVVGSTNYPIKAVEDWTWLSSKFMRLFVQELKR